MRRGKSAPRDKSKTTELQDRRRGAYDNVLPKPPHPRREHPTKHEAAQSGAGVRPYTEPTIDDEPERLARMSKKDRRK
jgi:hypothetical protein